jgi:hypothetical protein
MDLLAGAAAEAVLAGAAAEAVADGVAADEAVAALLDIGAVLADAAAGAAEAPGADGVAVDAAAAVGALIGIGVVLPLLPPGLGFLPVQADGLLGAAELADPVDGLLALAFDAAVPHLPIPADPEVGPVVAVPAPRRRRADPALAAFGGGHMGAFRLGDRVGARRARAGSRGADAGDADILAIGSLTVAAFGRWRAYPQAEHGVVDVPADRLSPGGNPFVMSRYGADGDRDSVCDACAEMLLRLGDDQWATGQARSAGESDDACVLRQLRTIGYTHGVDRPIDPRFATMAARLALIEWLDELASAVSRGISQRLLCHCTPSRCHCAAIIPVILARASQQRRAVHLHAVDAAGPADAADIAGVAAGGAEVLAPVPWDEALLDWMHILEEGDDRHGDHVAAEAAARPPHLDDSSPFDPLLDMLAEHAQEIRRVEAARVQALLDARQELLLTRDCPVCYEPCGDDMLGTHGGKVLLKL